MNGSSHQRRAQKPIVTAYPTASSSTASASSSSLNESYISYESHSTAPTSLTSGSHHTHYKTLSNSSRCDREQAYQTTTPSATPVAHKQQQKSAPAAAVFSAASSSSSVATYDSILSEMAPLRRESVATGYEEYEYDEDEDEDEEEEEQDLDRDYVLADPAARDIPPVLPPYRGCTSSDAAPVRPSTPQDFARLFPSLDRLAIRHDDTTPDGNMNLRIDTLVPLGHGRRPIALQLFHLRMHDLARREFSLRRYCRDSGREVCNAKRTYAEAPRAGGAVADVVRPALRRSVSSALRSVASPFHRSSTNTSPSKRPGSSSEASSSAASVFSASHQSTASSHRNQQHEKPRLVPTNRIKLEFSNYARVDIARRGGRNAKRYEFEWWGHTYAWKRVLDKNLNVVSFHLVRDGHGAPVAHIVPEMRSPNQVLGDEMAGAWVSPCYMWISDSSIIDAITDVADVIVATGVIAMVDDCIKERWQSKKPRRAITGDFSNVSPRSFMQSFFQRRHSDDHSSPLRIGRPVAAY